MNMSKPLKNIKNKNTSVIFFSKRKNKIKSRKVASRFRLNKA